MKKTLTILLTTILLATAVYAADLEDFPDMFISGNNLDAKIVVGDEAHSIDVISANTIATSLSGYMGPGTNFGLTLASTIPLSLDQNMIIVGNPCVNPLADLVMGSPSECLEDFSPGDSIIRLYENNGYYQILVAGYSDEGTQQAANRLAEFDLEGEELNLENEELKESDEAIEVNLQEEMQPPVECPAETCTEIERSCSGPNLITKLDCVYYVELNRECHQYSHIKTEQVNDSEECKPTCDGCVIGEACIAVGEKTADSYCSNEGLKPLKAIGEDCQNNYECSNNQCTNGKCGIEEEPGFFTKLINWLKSLFG